MRGQFWIKDDKKKMNEKEKKIKKFIKMKPMETIGDGVCGFLENHWGRSLWLFECP